MRALSASAPQPSFVWLRLLDEAVWEYIEGDLQLSEQRAIEGFEVGSAYGEQDAAVFLGGHMFNLRYQQGRSGELLEQIMQFAGGPDSAAAWRVAAALALIQSGREDEARELALAEDFQTVPWDATWSGAVFGWADVCARLGLGDRARELYKLLEPFSGQFAAGGCILYGSIAWALGRLATTLERYDEAAGHFTAATEIEERLGMSLFLARTRAGWARALIARGRPDDLERAGQMLEQAEHAATRLGAGGITRDVTECLAALAAIGTLNP